MVDFSKVEGVIFDFDGTLYNKSNFVKHLILSAPFYMFRMRADRNVRKELKGIYFGSEEEFFSYYISCFSNKTKLSQNKAEKWYKEFYIPAMVNILKKYYKAFPETKTIFTALHNKGIKTAVFSDYCCVKQRMTAIGLNGSDVDFISSAEELGGLKPCKEPFLEIAQKLNVEPGKILVVGDRADTDGKGAENAGMQFYQITANQSLATCFSQFLPC